MKVISGSSFSNCSSLASIRIPDSVTTIEEFAFSYCTSLKDILLGRQVGEIREKAFVNCNELNNIIALASSVVKIADKNGKSLNDITYCFDESTVKNATLQVRPESIEWYKRTSCPWSKFANICVLDPTKDFDTSKCDEAMAACNEGYQNLNDQLFVLKDQMLTLRMIYISGKEIEAWESFQNEVQNAITDIEKKIKSIKEQMDNISKNLNECLYDYTFNENQQSILDDINAIINSMPDIAQAIQEQIMKVHDMQECITAVGKVPVTTTDSNVSIYDLQGRKASRSTKNVIIVGNKKVIK